MKNKTLAAAVAVATLAIALSLLSEKTALPPLIPLTLRWLGIALIAAIAVKRRSLTPWILVGLLAGIEVGHDFPSFAANLQFLGTIFLGLISLIYFEIVSTIALLIGFAAINISRAGEGVRLPPSANAEPLNATPHSATQLIVDIFP